MAVGDYDIKPFAGPVGSPVTPERVRGNDETLRIKFVAHQGDVVAHVSSGDLADRPASGQDGAIYVALDTGDVAYWDGAAWQAIGGGGGGDVTGPASSTNDALVRFDGTTGKVIQNSSVTLDDDGQMIITNGTSQQLILRYDSTPGNSTALVVDASGNLRYNPIGAFFDKNFGIVYRVAIADEAGNLSFSGSAALGLPPSTTTLSSLRVPHGTAPSSPTNGDLWSTTSGFYGRVNGTTVGPFGAGGGGGATATTVEQNVGATAKWTGTFTITDAAITSTSRVLVSQAPGPYTGKGTRADEAEMDIIDCIAYPGTGSATVRWRVRTHVAFRPEPRMGQSLAGSGLAAAGTAVSINEAINGAHGEAVLIGKVKGNIKFTYQVFN